MKKKKIFLYIHQCILKGGVEKVFWNLLNNLPQDRYDITVLSCYAYLENDLYAGLYPKNVRRCFLRYDELSERGMKRFFQRLHNFVMPRVYPALLKFRKFDTAIAAQEGKYALFVRDHVRADKKLVWIHNDIALCHWTGKHFSSPQEERDCYAGFHKVICVSQAVADSMRSLFGEMDNLHVCYNPIDTAEIDRKMDQPVQREAAPLFVAVGRLAEQKGFDRLLRICRRLNGRGLDYRLWIVGEGEKRPELEAELAKGGLDNVRLLGKKANPFAYMKTADWLVCASRHEGFNMVLYEAAWCGTPAITTDNAGTTEFLGDSEYGIVTENNEDALFDAMCRVLEQPELLDKYRAAVARRKEFIDLPGRIAAIEQVL